MRNTHQFLIFFVFLTTSLVAQDRQAYIGKYKNIAIREMERAGVPASIKLAQGLLESGAGGSTLARKANNHFGIKCGSYWKGRTMYREDDDYDENGKLQKSCFRAYKSADESYIAHSEFLRDPKKEHRYGFLFNYKVTDYKRWARGLKRAGYATSPTYAEKLINIIETYSLNQYDHFTSSDLDDDGIQYDDTDMVAGLDLRLINDVKVVYAERNDTPANIGAKTNVKTKCILKYNEKLTEEATLLRRDELIFLQKKRKHFRGKKKWHYVREGETMYGISQLYGIRLKNTYKRNRMPEETQPEKDERIKLRGWKVSRKDRPRLRAGYVEPAREKKSDKKPEQNSTDEVNDDNWMDTENAVELGDKPATTTPSNNNSSSTNGSNNSSSNTSSSGDNSGNTNSGNTTNGGTSNPNDWNENTSNNNGSNTGSSTGNTGNNGSSGTGSTGTPTTVHPPVFNPNPPSTGSNSSGTETGDTQFYIVVKGDTLYSLSRKFGTSVSDLKFWNGLSNNLIYPGDKLRVR